jgi:hypothetical protein
MNAKDTAVVSATRAVTLVRHMPDLARWRAGLSNLAFGVEFARCIKFSMVMLLAPNKPVPAVAMITVFTGIGLSFRLGRTETARYAWAFRSICSVEQRLRAVCAKLTT